MTSSFDVAVQDQEKEPLPPRTDAEKPPADESPANKPPVQKIPLKDGYDAATDNSPRTPLVRHELRPQAMCSQIACQPDNRCCNRCAVTSWRIENGRDVHFGPDVTPPDCQVNGCGRCAKTFFAWGEIRGRWFVVSRLETSNE